MAAYFDHVALTMVAHDHAGRLFGLKPVVDRDLVCGLQQHDLQAHALQLPVLSEVQHLPDIILQHHHTAELTLHGHPPLIVVLHTVDFQHQCLRDIVVLFHHPIVDLQHSHLVKEPHHSQSHDTLDLLAASELHLELSHDAHSEFNGAHHTEVLNVLTLLTAMLIMAAGMTLKHLHVPTYLI